MTLDLDDSAELAHSGAKGFARERSIYQHFLRKYLPRHVEPLHLGDIRSVDGQVSAQQDLMIVGLNTPRLYSDEEHHQVVPVESVFCIGEVKSRLEQRDLEAFWANAATVKKMPKQAFRYPATNALDEHFDPQGLQRWAFPVAAFMFAYDSVDLSLLATRMHSLAARAVNTGDGPEHFVDAVFVLNKGYVFWGGPRTTTGTLSTQDGYFNCRPDAYSPVCPIATDEPGDVLVALALWLNDILADAWMPPFNISAYLGQATLGTSLGVTLPPGGRWVKGHGPQFSIQVGPATPR